MTEKLAGLVIPVMEPLGYQQGWGMATVARIRQEIPDDLGRLTLRQQNIDEVVTCGGLWQGREVATEIPAHVFLLRRDLFVRVAREYLEAAVIDEAPKPIDFVRTFLGTEANFSQMHGRRNRKKLLVSASKRFLNRRAVPVFSMCE
jgi:hypothetical protein